jgi:hypothetical protein
MKHAALGAAIVTTALVLAARASAATTGSKAASAASSESEAVSLMFDEGAPADCPSEADFKAEVIKLTSKARFIKSKRARRIRIELESRGNDVVGRLVTGDGKNKSSREVRGKDCKEVSSALAIAVALTIDPEALGATEPEPTPEPKQPATPPPPKPADPKPPEASKPPATKTKLHFGLGVGLTLESAWAPQMRPGGHALGVFGVGERFRINLGALYFPTREVEGVSFSAWLGQGSVSWNIAVLGVLRPFVALGYEAGAVVASGSGLSTKMEAKRPWQAFSAALGLRFETEGFFLQLGGSFLVPISRQRYLISDPFGNLTHVYENQPFGLKQETSLGVFL